MKRVLVTGATGFIGRHSLTPLLRRGYEVHGVTEACALADPAGVIWHQADLLVPGQVERMLVEVRPSHLLHFAWFARPGEYWTSPENLRWVQASLSLLRVFSREGGHRLVSAGTCAEYDWGHGLCLERETPLSGATLYGVCKRAVFAVQESFAAQMEMSAAWGRIFMLYGPHEDRQRLVPSVILPLLRGQPAPCSHGRQIRDFLHVADVGEAFAALLDSTVTGPVNIASGHPAAIGEVVQMIAVLVGRPELVRMGAVQAPAGEPERLVADVSRLTTEVGWTPRYDLESGLRQTIDWWQAALAEKPS